MFTIGPIDIGNAVSTSSAPPASVNGTYFYGRITGYLVPSVTGVYTVGVNCEDGCNLYLGSQPLVANLAGQDAALTSLGFTRSSPIELTAGVFYPITIEWQHGLGSKYELQLLWTTPGGVTQLIPAANLSDTPDSVTNVLDARYWNGTSGLWYPTGNAVIDFANPAHPNKTLDNIADGTSRSLANLAAGSDLAAEVTRAEAAESALSTAITAETTRAEAAEAALAASIGTGGSGGSSGGGGDVPVNMSAWEWLASGASALVSTVPTSFGNSDLPNGYVEGDSTANAVYLLRPIASGGGSTPWSISIKMLLVSVNTGIPAMGLVAWDSASNKAVMWFLYQPVTGQETFVYEQNYTSTNSYSGTIGSWGNVSPQTVWLKIASDGTNVNFYIGADGAHWVKMGSQPLSAWGSPTHYGLLANPNNGGASAVTGVTVVNGTFS